MRIEMAEAEVHLLAEQQSENFQLKAFAESAIDNHIAFIYEEIEGVANIKIFSKY